MMAADTLKFSQKPELASLHTKWRLYFYSTSGGRVRLNEVQLRDVAGGSHAGGSVAASGQTASYSPSKAVDGNVTTYWLSEYSSAGGFWISFSYATPIEIVEVAITSGEENSQEPISFKIEYSDDGVLWLPAAEFSNVPNWGYRETRVYSAS